MTEQAGQIVDDALQEILVKAAEVPLEAAETATGLRYLNRMMAMLDARTITLGYTAVSSPSDDVTIPDGAIDGVISNLAIALAPQFKKPVSIELAERAKQGLQAMRLLSSGIGPAEFPDTLPIGSGNEGESFRSDRFYQDLEDNILAETNGSISLETNT
jgi:hypothetical protein